ncbi:trypsin alpha-3-like [Stomoxys calcitrans]|uniref:Peptidase S1 domain-containing protein n=1 Tax=Stomoxys calcitrans TaxID=35570 RepID=A0A1I8NZN4_STOCA|nr:trypsin alpha-3-like [Stomoxys calcitrans]
MANVQFKRKDATLNTMLTINKLKLLLAIILVLQLSPVGFCRTRAKARKTGARKVSPRIVGGTTTSIANVPYVVQLRENGRYICAGALVGRRFVVTAAHCIVGVTPAQLTVVGGASSLTQTGVRRAVNKIIRPRGYTETTLNKDVAVIKLASDMTGSNIATIPLNTQRLTTRLNVRVSGWGQTSENATGVARNLRTVVVPIVGKQGCARQYSGTIALTGSMFCAGQAGRDSCIGDSGGPAVANGRLVGVVSFGNGCGRARFPGIYTSTRSTRSIILRGLRQ